MQQRIYFELLCIFLYTQGSMTYQYNIETYSALNHEKLRLIYLWDQLDFAFPNETARQQAIKSGEYVPGCKLVGDIDIAHGKGETKLFITFPRVENGTLATLGYILPSSNKDGKNIPIVMPYPNWELNKIKNCKTNLISVYQIKIDECGRLWVLDSGKIGSQICPPKIVMFNLSSDQPLIDMYTYEFPKDHYTSNSLFANLAVDVRQNCSDTFIYIADPTGCQLIVYDHTNNDSWTMKHNIFSYDLNYTLFFLAQYGLMQMDGVLGLALGPITENSERILFFHSLSSVTENSIGTSVLRTGKSYANYSTLELPTSMKGKRSSQSGVEVIDRNGVLFSTKIIELKITCWNIYNSPFEEIILDHLSIVDAKDPGRPFALNLKIINLPNGRDELWINFAFFTEKSEGEFTTYTKVYAGYTDELVDGTNCAAFY